ncbi:phage tail protein [Pseudomonas koreensis]|uniref:phage tail protein n=1 Tax=Pseudomonas koreensis TaxID=198620 RepID=UPI001F019C7B|nr:phage tail protein [Pseudomonas koreensis]
MVDKNSIFGGMLTTQGAAKKTNCDALGIPWEPRYMLIGDANGTDPVPSQSQTKLINQVYRAQLNQLRVSPTDENVLIAELVLPPDVGGWWIRELALEDKDGVFSAVANAAPSYKPLLGQGSGRNQVVRMHVITSGTSNIQLKIDPSVVLATREYVDARILEELYKLDNKQSVRVATTANIALSGLQVVDGVTLVAGDRVLVKNQNTAKDNGLYAAAAGNWSRTADADTNAEVTSALLVSVEQGATQADSRWQLITDATIVLGTTALSFQDVTFGFAPLKSPKFTGIPEAPTAAQDVATEQVATTAFVLAQAADAMPKTAGQAAPGVGKRFSRTDHVHPTDASRAGLTDLPFRGFLAWLVPGVYQWTVPAGVTKAYVVVKGGGGSGRNSQVFGPGGGAGGVAEGLVALVPGDVTTITVGAGGAGVSYSVSGSPGMNGAGSSFGGYMSATGGEGGGSSGAGGKSGIGSGGTLNYGLGDGHSGGRASSTAYGFPGSGGGAGGAGAVVDGAGVGQSLLRAGQSPGSGGGGRMDSGGVSGAGAPGSVTVRF